MVKIEAFSSTRCRVHNYRSNVISARLPHPPASRGGYGSRSSEGLMQITDILSQVGGLQSIARELGVSESHVATGAAALAPAILGGLKKQAQIQPGGVDGLGGLLGSLGGGSLLDNVLSQHP